MTAPTLKALLIRIEHVNKELRELQEQLPHGGENEEYWHVNPKTGVTFHHFI